MSTFQSNSFFWSALLLPGIIGCRSERATIGPGPQLEQEITRFRAKNPTARPYLFGRVEVLDKSGNYALSSAILSIDKELSYADKSGIYGIFLTAGTHQLMTGQIGIKQSRLVLMVEQGDSIRINFHLHPETQPLE